MVQSNEIIIARPVRFMCISDEGKQAVGIKNIEMKDQGVMIGMMLAADKVLNE